MTLDDVLAALDESDTATTVSSVRQPRALRRALMAAVELGWVPNANEAQCHGLRSYLEALAQRSVLDAHYESHPDVRPDLAEVAIALAEIDHNPLAEHRSLIEQASREVMTVRPDADADDVLLWAASLHRHAVTGTRDACRSA